jgi:hypothetical protein
LLKKAFLLHTPQTPRPQTPQTQKSLVQELGAGTSGLGFLGWPKRWKVAAEGFA